MQTTISPLVDLYRQVLAIKDEDPAVTPEQQAALTTASTAFTAAREQVSAASRTRKDKDAKVAEAQAILDVATAAYTEAQKPIEQAEADVNRRAFALAERLWTAIAEEAFDGKVRFVNQYPTEETRSDYYGEHRVYRTVVEDTYSYEEDTAMLRGFERPDLPFRLIPRANLADDLSFEVVLLDDETFEGDPTVRQDRTRAAHISFRRDAYSGPNKVEVGWGSGSTRSVEAAALLVEAYSLTLRVARIIEDIVKEAKVK